MDQKAHLLLFPCGLQIGQTVHRLGALCRLAELELNGLGAVFGDGDLRHAQGVVLHVALGNDLAVAAIILVEGLQNPAQEGEVHNFTVFDLQLRILAFGILAHHTGDTCHGGTGKIILPVQLDEGGQDDGHGQLDGMQGAVFHLSLHIKNGGLVGVGRCALGAEHVAVDVEVGVIQRIDLFRGDLVGTGGGGIDRLDAQHGGKADVTGGGAALYAHGAHTGSTGAVGAAVGGGGKAGSEIGRIRHNKASILNFFRLHYSPFSQNVKRTAEAVLLVACHKDKAAFCSFVFYLFLALIYVIMVKNTATRRFSAEKRRNRPAGRC